MNRPKFLLVLAMALLASSQARAAITAFDAFGNQQYVQNSNSAPAATPQDFFASRIFSTSASDVTAATGTTGAPANLQPLTYAPIAGSSPAFALSQTGFISDAALAPYLTGTIKTTVTGGTASGTVLSANFGSTLFPSAIPTLTNNSYSLLQGLNASQGALINFNGFTAVPGASESDIFITISNVATGQAAFSFNTQNLSTTSFNILANTLAAGTAYNLEIDYSSRLTGTVAGNANIAFTAGYDRRTEVAFTTAAAVPEPASLALTTIGVASALLALRKRGRKAANLA